MSVRGVAIIYDDSARPETTGVYCKAALAQLVKVEHFRPGELSTIPRQGFDLYLQIDDGLAYHLPPELHPCAWWAIDTHMNFDWCLTKARDFDFVFAAQYDGTQELRDHGIATVSWLPLAADPKLHRPFALTQTYDVCFVGNVFPGPRAELLKLIQQRFPNIFVGHRYFEEMARTYSASKIVFNRSIKNDVNMRVFEALACGGFLLTNDLSDNGQEELFKDGVHLGTYHGPEDLLDKIGYYLSHEKVRKKIAERGRKHILARHTYRHRMEKILSEVQKGAGRPTTPSTMKPVPSPSVGTTGKAGIGARKADAAIGAAPYDPGYFQFARPELLDLIPDNARKILDIGCGAGRLGEAIKKRQTAEVVGIEMIESAARLARERLDQVLVGDVEAMAHEFQPSSFDVIVCGDVLEHLRDPSTLLRRVRYWLKSDGRLVTSIPNVRHHSVVRGLLDGNWTYESAGLLDRTHLRFFTRREIEKLLFRAGFALVDMQGVLGTGDQEAGAEAKAGRLNIGNLHLTGMPAEQVQEFFVYQYLLAALPDPAPDWGLTSIIILTHNELPYTRTCLDSIRLCTDEPFELVVVDNASTDGTVEYLQSVPDVRLIRNTENLGFPKAANQGIQAASGLQILLLNNDCIVTTGWLCRLLRALHSDPKIGLVGPCSNLVSGEQEVPVGYDDLSGLDGFAWDFGQANNRKQEEADRLVGFCLLIRRGLIDEIGPLDERFGLGCFEDDDYCRRALQAGYRVIIARDAFVHHFGGQTFRATGVDFGALMNQNRRLFEEKWEAKSDTRARTPAVKEAGRPTDGETRKEREGSASNTWTIRRHPKGGLLLVRREIELSACIIARDNARTIEA